MAQLVKNLPAMQETWVRSLDWENPLEKGMATNSTPLFWPGDKESDRTQRLSIFTILESQKYHVHKGRDWREAMCVQRGPCFSHRGHPSTNPGARDGFAPGLLPRGCCWGWWGTLGQATGVGGHGEGRVVLEEVTGLQGSIEQGPWDSELLGCG